MKHWKRDLIYGITILVFSVVNFIIAGNIEAGTIRIRLAQAEYYMKMWLVILGILGIILIVKALYNKDSETLEPIFTKLAIFTICVIGLYLFAMPYLGFLLSSMLFLVSTITVFFLGSGTKKYPKKMFYKKLLINIFIGITAAFITDIFFRNVLNVLLPKFSLL